MSIYLNTVHPDCTPYIILKADLAKIFDILVIGPEEALVDEPGIACDFMGACADCFWSYRLSMTGQTLNLFQIKS